MTVHFCYWIQVAFRFVIPCSSNYAKMRYSRHIHFILRLGNNYQQRFFIYKLQNAYSHQGQSRYLAIILIRYYSLEHFTIFSITTMWYGMRFRILYNLFLYFYKNYYLLYRVVIPFPRILGKIRVVGKVLLETYCGDLIIYHKTRTRGLNGHNHSLLLHIVSLTSN